MAGNIFIDSARRSVVERKTREERKKDGQRMEIWVKLPGGLNRPGKAAQPFFTSGNTEVQI